MLAACIQNACSNTSKSMVEKNVSRLFLYTWLIAIKHTPEVKIWEHWPLGSTLITIPILALLLNTHACCLCSTSQVYQPHCYQVSWHSLPHTRCTCSACMNVPCIYSQRELAKQCQHLCPLAVPTCTRTAACSWTDATSSSRLVACWVRAPAQNLAGQYCVHSSAQACSWCPGLQHGERLRVNPDIPHRPHHGR